MINTNGQPYNNFSPENATGVEGKKTDNNSEKTSDKKETNSTDNPYKESDSAEINKDNTRNSEHPVTVVDFASSNKTSESSVNSKPQFTGDDAKIADFISKVKDETFDAILKSFDQMLANARKMMEESQKILKDKIIPREEAMKKELAIDQKQKEILAGS